MVCVSISIIDVSILSCVSIYQIYDFMYVSIYQC
jgi:hypothetical protein